MKKGFTLLEVLVGASILTASFLGVLTVFDRLTRATNEASALVEAGFLLSEGVETARIWRDNNWSNLGNWPAGTEYFLTWTGTAWATSTTNVLLDGKFDRRIKVETVERDSANGDIVSSGGETDPGTKLVIVTVAWFDHSSAATTTKSLAAYLSDLFE